MEEKARKDGATNAQIGQIRRADAALARDRLRQHKTASRLTTPGYLTPGGSGNLTPRGALPYGYLSSAGSLSRRLSIQSSTGVSLQPIQSNSTSQSDSNPQSKDHTNSSGAGLP